MQTFTDYAKTIKVPSQPVGTFLLAMTKGEVHDMGKTVIKGVFLHNQFKVIDLGVVSSPESIVKAWREERPDVIGLSAMLCSSLEWMQEIARALDEAGCTCPLLIGGAATTPQHTATFIAPLYAHGITIPVKDLHHCQDTIPYLLTWDELKATVVADNARLREAYQVAQKRKKILTLQEARKQSIQLDWQKTDIKKPKFLGVKGFPDYDLQDVLGCVDWTTLFMGFGLKGKFPSILKDKDIGEDAQKLYDDAQIFLKDILHKKIIKAHAVLGFFPAQSRGDDIEVDVNGQKHILHTLRQQAEHPSDKPYYALADFIAPQESGLTDYIGMFVLTAGDGLKELILQYEAEGNYYKSIMAKSVADILAESFAERFHERVRKEFWGYAPEEDLTINEMFQCRFQGIRPAPGYPACPDHSEKPLLFELLQASDHTGVHLSETFAMDPAPSICGVYFAHPQAKYFWIGALGEDQLEDYARRKGEDLKKIKKQLVFHTVSV